MSLYLFKNQTDETFNKTTALLTCVSRLFSFRLHPAEYATSSQISSSSRLFDDTYFRETPSQYEMICNINASIQILYAIKK